MQGALDVLKEFCQQDLPEDQLMGFLREIAPVLIALLNRPEVSLEENQAKQSLTSNRLHRQYNRPHSVSSENPSTRFITSRTNTLKKRNVPSRKSSLSGLVTCDNRSCRLISERHSQRTQKKLGNCSKSGIRSSRSVALTDEQWLAADILGLRGRHLHEWRPPSLVPSPTMLGNTSRSRCNTSTS